ncbi:MAG TPA: hypothetical protein P5144_15330 [Thermoanaerobaculia bacterium]|jgi:hypothetical protein|nr:hypothetical protein [Thermoanaerobaculia bacterium]
MAEITSRQVTARVLPGRAEPSQEGGKVRKVFITSPAAVTWANGDTIGSGKILPAGVRFTAGSIASHAAMAASVVLAVGIRDASGTEIDADGICASVSVASAGRTAINNGALVAAGVEYITTVPCEVYATLSGATPTANAQIRIEVEYVGND